MACVHDLATEIGGRTAVDHNFECRKIIRVKSMFALHKRPRRTLPGCVSCDRLRRPVFRSGTKAPRSARGIADLSIVTQSIADRFGRVRMLMATIILATIVPDRVKALVEKWNVSRSGASSPADLRVRPVV